MNNEQKNSIVHQTKGLIQSYVNILERYSNFMSLVFPDRADFLMKTLVSIKGNNESYWASRLQNLQRQVPLFSELTQKLAIFQINFQDNEFLKGLTPQYIQLINAEISSENNLINIGNWLQTAFHENHIFSDVIDFSIKKNSVENFSNALEHSQDLAFRFLQKLAQLDAFDHFNTIDHSVVIIGANGSGKSSFARNTRKILSGNVVIISAQKIFTHKKITSIPIGEKVIQNVHNFQTNEKLGKNWENQSIYDHDLYNLVLSLISEHNQQANIFYSSSKTIKTDRKPSILEQVMEVWSEIVVHRSMKFEGVEIKICTSDGQTYEFPYLSDGEKAIFYYISHVLIAKETSYIIIDEPENHLHMAVVPKLWDKLEELRRDCKFIYLTHNLDFASSRVKATKLWNRHFEPPAKWDVKPLPIDDDLPESLLMELLGSRRRILFCEGQKSSLDYKLYTLMFAEYTVKPVGGHLDVINFTRAFNKSKEIFGNTAIGIIDGDFHSNDQKEKWKSQFIYCVEAQELENILCDEILIKAGISHFHSESNTFENVKTKLLKELEKKVNEQCNEYTVQKINNILKSNLLENIKSQDDIKKKFEELISSINIEKFISERKNHFEEIIKNKNFEQGIISFNNKGLASIVGNIIVNDYAKRILGLLESDSELLKKLKEKYFSMVPDLGEISGVKE